MRGKVLGASKGCDGVGITPACAGKSRIRAGRGAAFGDHPPPRMRGKVRLGAKAVGSTGITPACAGKSDLYALLSLFKKGSPPHVRGKD